MQRTSIYNKLYVLLTHLSKRQFKDTYELSKWIADKKIDVFEVPTKEKAKKYCSAAAIRKTIALAMRLKLIDVKERCALTSDGAAAARDDFSFKQVLGAQVISYLNNKQFGIQRILETIDRIELPHLPDAETIFERGKTENSEIDEKEFKSLLYLLYLSDKVDRQPKYLYLRKGKKN